MTAEGTIALRRTDPMPSRRPSPSVPAAVAGRSPARADRRRPASRAAAAAFVTTAKPKGKRPRRDDSASSSALAAAPGALSAAALRDLRRLRRAIDRLHVALWRLLDARVRAARAVAGWKATHGLSLLDRSREAELAAAAARGLRRGGLAAAERRAILRAVLRATKAALRRR
jgi:chorismate mutase